MKVRSSETKENEEVGMEPTCKLPFIRKRRNLGSEGSKSTPVVLHWGDFAARPRPRHVAMSGTFRAVTIGGEELLTCVA